MSDQNSSVYDATRHWRRWEMESFDPAPTPAPSASGQTAERGASVPKPADILAEIERLRESAQARGQAEGYAAGHAQGHEAGLREGFERGLHEGRETGYAEGHTQGLEAARSEAERLQQLAQACAQAIDSIESEAGDALVSLALSVAEQVLRSTLNTEPQRILDLIRDVLYMESSQQGLLTLRLNPADLELVDPYLQQEATATQWRLRADSGIERGGCIVETALGSIDATLQTRWQRVVSALGTKT